jgi:hypothetical protein
MSSLLDMFGFDLLLLLLLLSSFWSKKNSRIFVFLFSGLFFLITSLGFSISLYSSGFVVEGFSKVNADVLFVFLCLDKPRCFFFINSESTERSCDRGSLVMKTV